jgi:cyclopropane-fatty-acyl-phospholipid synthase
LDQLSAHVPIDDIAQALVVTSPRLLGYVFNPVSFYLCYGRGGQPLAAVAEVNNTFGEKHVYVLPVTEASKKGFPLRFQAEKAFHVSPFNTSGGPTPSPFRTSGANWTSRSICTARARHILRARLKGQPRRLSALNHMKTLLRIRCGPI